MAQSMTLMSAQIHFLDAQLSLIHIPLTRYHQYLQSLLKLLFPLITTHASLDHKIDDFSPRPTAWANRHAFLNVSVTPIECSIVCSHDLAREFFSSESGPASTIGCGSGSSADGATISSEDLVVISVEGEGLDPGQRVLELTSPLASAGISIFFITTYFSDYILVPARSRGQVIRALEDRGFAFEKRAEAYINSPSTSSSPSSSSHHRNKSSTSSLGALGGTPAANPPPPATIAEWQALTFALLEQRNIIPKVETDIQLIQCAGRRDDPTSFSVDEMGLQLGLTKCLIHQPRFLSLTLTQTDPASLLLEKRLLPNFGSEDALLGSIKEDCLIPITLDLEPLPLEATGIVCGVAGKLVRGANGKGGAADAANATNATADDADGAVIEMSYLSTARAGTVMVEEKDLQRAMKALGVGVGVGEGE